MRVAGTTADAGSGAVTSGSAVTTKVTGEMGTERTLSTIDAVGRSR